MSADCREEGSPWNIRPNLKDKEGEKEESTTTPREIRKLKTNSPIFSSSARGRGGGPKETFDSEKDRVWKRELETGFVWFFTSQDENRGFRSLSKRERSKKTKGGASPKNGCVNTTRRKRIPLAGGEKVLFLGKKGGE